MPSVFDGEKWEANGPIYDCVNPTTGKLIKKVQFGTKEDMIRTINNANKAKKIWAETPAPKVKLFIIISYISVVI